MENASLLSVAAENVTTSLFKSDDVANYLTNIRDLVLKVIYIIIGTVGVLDNLFVIVVFFLFIKITDKVFLTTVYILKHLKTCSMSDYVLKIESHNCGRSCCIFFCYSEVSTTSNVGQCPT